MRRPTRRRTPVTAASALAAAVGLGLGLAGPAAAGGPTSALLVNGGSGDAAALYATDPGYKALDKAIGDTGERLDPLRTDAELGGMDGRRITVTWLQHDVHVWRVDTLYPDARGGAVVSRAAGADATAATETWRRVAHPERLGSLLDRLGVAEEPEEQRGWYVPRQFGAEGVPPGGGGSPEEEDGGDGAAGGAGGAGGTAAGPPAEAAEAEAAAAPDGDAATAGRAAATPDPGPGTNWWWTLPGLATGALLTAAVPRLRGRRTAAGPRGVLLDQTDRPDREG
ncbi:hypothetical protein [Streptomyces sp. MAR4 CNX-425]|uniref:hypothetical protein n=1 Tax=Streptomyces sp. MAR4 CNX-425 TaxID=3406343 RepID=UPI003B500C63